MTRNKIGLVLGQYLLICRLFFSNLVSNKCRQTHWVTMNGLAWGYFCMTLVYNHHSDFWDSKLPIGGSCPQVGANCNLVSAPRNRGPIRCANSDFQSESQFVLAQKKRNFRKVSGHIHPEKEYFQIGVWAHSH